MLAFINATSHLEGTDRIILSNNDIIGITENLAKLAVSGFASAEDMDKDAKNLIAKALKLHEYSAEDLHMMAMGFSVEGVA